jgi:hypothetical protein
MISALVGVIAGSAVDNFIIEHSTRERGTRNEERPSLHRSWEQGILPGR